MALVGFEVIAATPKGARAPEQPTSTPMRPKKPGQRAPSADQQKVRREISRTWQQKSAATTPAFTTNPFASKPPSDSCTNCGSTSMTMHRDDLGVVKKCRNCGEEQDGSVSFQNAARPPVTRGNWALATQIGVDAWLLNPGAKIRGPNGRLLTIQKVEPHKSNSGAVNIHTDQGIITESPRNQSYHVVTDDQQQHELPGDTGYGGNSNTLPGGSRQDAGGGNKGFTNDPKPNQIPGNAQKRNVNGQTVWVTPDGKMYSGGEGYGLTQNADPNSLGGGRRKAALDEHGGTCPIDGSDLHHVGGEEHHCEEGHSISVQAKDPAESTSSFALASSKYAPANHLNSIASRARAVLQEGTL